MRKDVEVLIKELCKRTKNIRNGKYKKDKKVNYRKRNKGGKRVG